MKSSTATGPASVSLAVLGLTALASAWLAPPVHAGTTFLNLDFEVAPVPGQAKGWFQGGRGYEVTLDSEIVHSGEHSLRIRSVAGDPQARTFGVATSSFPVEDAAGKTIRYSGWIRTENVEGGRAGLWWRVDGGVAPLAFDNMQDRGPRGSTAWSRHVIELEVPEGATNINFGVLMPGTGSAWFDGLQIELDGETYAQVEPIPFEPTDAQISWLRKQGVAFVTDDPAAPLDDLKPLREIVGEARIVALGEATHGTREFFRFKHRVVRYLAEEMGFTVFAIEASLPEAERVNRYVLHGEGDPKKALGGLYFWTWNTREVLDLIEWMRRYNASGEGRMEFRGFDMQYPDVALGNVESFLGRVDPETRKTVQAAYEEVRRTVREVREQRRTGGRPTPDSFEPWHDAAREVLELLEARQDRYLASEEVSPREVAWAVQNARVVVQSAEAQMQGGASQRAAAAPASRDRSMAANVEWILEQQPPETKIVLWAHNSHVSRTGVRGFTPMGHHLAERYGDEMVVMGLVFHHGRYTAVGPRGLGTYDTTDSRAGTFEWAFHRTGEPRLLLDLRRVPKDDGKLSAWLHDELELRSIGAMAVQDAFYPVPLTDAFDVLVFFDRTTPSVQLDTRPAAPEP